MNINQKQTYCNSGYGETNTHVNKCYRQESYPETNLKFTHL